MSALKILAALYVLVVAAAVTVNFTVTPSTTLRWKGPGPPPGRFLTP